MMDCVTGAKGFIGSHLVAELKKRSKSVLTIDLPEYDIRTKSHLAGIDTIYHLAGLSNIIPSITNPRDYYETNVTGTFNMLEAARLSGVNKFVYAASASCYGSYGELCTEAYDFPDPCYPYALTKYLGEELVMHYGKVYDMDVVSCRIFNAYGNKSLTKNAYGAMFNTFLAQKANGKPLTIVGDGTQSRDFVHVEDVVEAFILAAENGTGIINIGTGIPTSINRIAEIIGGETVNIPERGGEPHCIYADNSRLKALGWRPKYTIEQGIEKLMDNIDYWKDAKVWEPNEIKDELKEWSRRLG